MPRQNGAMPPVGRVPAPPRPASSWDAARAHLDLRHHRRPCCSWLVRGPPETRVRTALACLPRPIHIRQHGRHWSWPARAIQSEWYAVRRGGGPFNEPAVGRSRLCPRQSPQFEFGVSDFDHRLRVQKFVYLLQSFDVYLGHDYSWYLRGPYCSTLAGFYADIPLGVRMAFSIPAVNDRFENFKRSIDGRENDADFLEIAASFHFLEAGGRLARGEILQRVANKRPQFTKKSAPASVPTWKNLAFSTAAPGTKSVRGTAAEMVASTAPSSSAIQPHLSPGCRTTWIADHTTRGFTTCWPIRGRATKGLHWWAGTYSGPTRSIPT